MGTQNISAEESGIFDCICGYLESGNNLDIPEDAKAKCLLAAKDYSQQINRLVLSQLQPHFLFNVLNMIYYMCGKDTDTARNMINDFSTYLRANMAALQNPAPIPLEQEIAHVHLYLRFEQMRFRDRFRMEYDISCLDFKLPPLTLQPLVENAVRHGVCQLSDGGIVRIESEEKEDCYAVRIIDNGVGFDMATTESGGKNNLGLSLIRTRLEKISGGKLVIHSIKGRGTVAEVQIPKKEERL